MKASKRPKPSPGGSLTVVGVGINGAPQTTPEAVFCMRRAQQLFYLVTHPATEAWVRELNPRSASLHDLYAIGKLRSSTYAEMTDRIVGAVLAGLDVCAAFYGHPGVLVHATQRAIRRVRRAGHPARMLPGVSAEGCLYADLGLNPGDHGVQSFEATDFLMSRRRFDPTSELILWQIGVIGEANTRDAADTYRADWMKRLSVRLLRTYPARHRVVLYEAPTFPAAEPVIRRVGLQRLSSSPISPTTLMYVPALPQRPLDPRILSRFDA